MLEKADLTLSLDKATYKQALPRLQERLRGCQALALQHQVPVVVVFEGWDGAGKGSNIALLSEKLDPRRFKVYPIAAPTAEEAERPFLWRFWRKLPLNGEIAIFDRSWYGRVLVERVDGLTPKKEWERAFDEINQFERQLSDDGALILKFWLHISKKEQKKRLTKLDKDPTLTWKVTKEDWRHHKQYKEYLQAVEEMMARTSTHWAPWTIVEAEDKRYAAAEIHETIIRAIEEEVEQIRRTRIAQAAVQEAVAANPGTSWGSTPASPTAVLTARSAAAEHSEADPTPPGTNPASVPPTGTHPVEAAAAEMAGDGNGSGAGFGLPLTGRSTLLDQVDLTRSLSREEYQDALQPLQAQMRRLQRDLLEEEIPVLVIYEGWDAAGKGGNIKRLTQFLDPRGYYVTPYAAPTQEEKRHHYLWRFWRDLPGGGQLGIFDRSWYGRVLVERVEGFCTEKEWRRAFQEINEFEGQVTAAGLVLVKFWLHISQEEQLRRFEDRKQDKFRYWKLTDEDWRNREKFPLYKAAVTDMLEKTSTAWAPWTIVEANDKPHARVKVLKTVAGAIEEALA
jgi:polyphosphate kinase 2 (PPK2 family)